MPLWTHVEPRILQRGVQHQRLLVRGWRFPADEPVVCRFSFVDGDGLHLGTSVANVTTTNELECRTPSWHLLTSSKAQVLLEILASNRSISFQGNSSFVYVLDFARTRPITALVSGDLRENVSSEEHDYCNQGNSNVRIPRGQFVRITWVGAHISPYSFVALATNSSCQGETFLEVSHKTISSLASQITMDVYNDAAFKGRVYVCYSTDGVQGPFYHQPAVSLTLESRAMPHSISRLVPGQLGSGQAGRVSRVGCRMRSREGRVSSTTRSPPSRAGLAAARSRLRAPYPNPSPSPSPNLNAKP